jgi:ParB family chromosome partitioning protein
MKYQITRRDLIDPDENQPRRSLDQEHIQQLSESINQHGILQPLIVYVNGDRYMAVDGHYRLAASGLLALKDVPTLVLPSKPDADMLLLTQLAGEQYATGPEAHGKSLGISEAKRTQGIVERRTREADERQQIGGHRNPVVSRLACRAAGVTR